MPSHLKRAVALLLTLGVLSGCAAIAGGAVVIAADKALEEENGDDGLF